MSKFQYETVWERENRLSQKKIVEETEGESNLDMLKMSSWLCLLAFLAFLALIGYIGGVWLATKIFN